MLFDGGMGSEIERMGIKCSHPEDLNITNADSIKSIHKSYAVAGADFITTNTFGLNRVKYKGNYTLSELADAAIENARAAKATVFFDIGPTGSLLKPIGTLSFDDAYEAFREIVDITAERVDGYILETFSDPYELKAAVLAVKEGSRKPVFATMTFDSNERTLVGTPPEVMVELLEGLGVDALGINCSLGPAEIGGTLSRIVKAAHIPVIIQPNRGLPKIKNGSTVYDMSKEEFAESIEPYIAMGVSVIGGCCGTTPEFIKEIRKYKGMNVTRQDNPYITAVTSYTKYTKIEDITVVGERLNPTGKPKIKNAILNEDYDYLISEGISQEAAGADILDVNVGIPKINEPIMMRRTVEKLQEYITLPIQIDSSSPDAIENAARYYNGIPLINSVNGDERVMASIFPIAKKYGAVVLGLTLDENGIPKSAKERTEIAKKIIATAERYGIPRHKIMIDTLTLTASAEQSCVMETLRALTEIRSLGVMTALGVSNISYGLPSRPLINRTFLAMAMEAGLTMPILNPLDTDMMDTVDAFRVLSGIDTNAKDYINRHGMADREHTVQGVSAALTLSEAVTRGIRNGIEELTKKELQSKTPLEIINEVLIPALNEIGREYSEGRIFLPQLISSADAAKTAFGVITEYMPAMAIAKETVVMASVKGDVHDIGKNIVSTVLSSYGYRVIDLGKDVPKEKIVNACIEYKPIAVGLSALMTTTVASMEETVKALRETNTAARIFVGGAVLNADTAKEIGADYYTEDALGFVGVLENEIRKQ